MHKSYTAGVYSRATVKTAVICYGIPDCLVDTFLRLYIISQDLYPFSL